MLAALKSPLAKKIASVVVGLCGLSLVPGSPLAPYAAILVPVGSFLAGAYHIDTTPKVAP